MTARVLMVQGTASHVGKSVLVAALCRIFRQDGFWAAPFKSQNMSLNSYVTPDGLEIGRAQANQAQAAGVKPSVEMNPILLKPEADARSQVVVMGKPMRTAGAREYFDMHTHLWGVVTSALDRLRQQYEVVVIEGAGSPAEVNLRAREIVNMRVARYAESPVILASDIDRGGVFASLIGTLDLLEPEERALVKGLIVNKFRGDASLFDSGVSFLEERTGLPVLGVVPFFKDIHIPEEDGVYLQERRTDKPPAVLDIAVVRLPHISNFDDFDPLAREQGVRLRYVTSVKELGDPDAVIIPGTKTTMADLFWMRERGLESSIKRLAERGKAVIGICGGYQMLGRSLRDPLGVESPEREAEGMGLLPVDTGFTASKDTYRIDGEVMEGRGLFAKAKGLAFQGYEIHMGQSSRAGGEPAMRLKRGSARGEIVFDGCLDASGRVMGTYVHGLFQNPRLRRAILEQMAEWKGAALPPSADFEQDLEYDKLADWVRSSLKMDLIYKMTGLARAAI